MIASEKHSCHKDFLELFSLFEICYTSWVYKATSTSLSRDLILEAGVRPALLSLHKSPERHTTSEKADVFVWFHSEESVEAAWLEFLAQFFRIN